MIGREFQFKTLINDKKKGCRTPSISQGLSRVSTSNLGHIPCASEATMQRPCSQECSTGLLPSLTSHHAPPPRGRGVGTSTSHMYKSHAGNFGLVEKICRLSPLHLLGSPKTGTVLSWVALGLEKAKSQKKAPKAKTKKNKVPSETNHLRTDPLSV